VAAKARLGLVPTMGALHAGHLSLVERALKECREVVVSIFVNPTQFGQGEDFGKYPRQLAADKALLRKAGAIRVFAPSVNEVYPEGFATTLKVGGSLGSVLEAEFRPGHFDGVATVVARLFGLVKPDKAYFGLKDFQQLAVIKRMTSDLALPVRIVECPTLRAKDGLALSSRNAYLSPEQRRRAPALWLALHAAADALAAGLSPSKAEALGKKSLAQAGGFKLQYLRVADAATLSPPTKASKRLVIAAAAHLGKTRLIDNLVMTRA
jgi:pantoate--beta-alanine ligase